LYLDKIGAISEVRQKRKSGPAILTSVLPSTADIRQRGGHVRKVPLPAAHSIMSRLSRTIDLRGFNWQAFLLEKVSRSDPLRADVAAIFQSYLKNGLLH
jgi:hypothetical protein